MKFEIGDSIECLIRGDDLSIGTKYTVLWTDGLSVKVIDDVGDENTKTNNYFKLDKKNIWGDDKFMVFGTGCNNKSNIVDNIEDLKLTLAKVSRDSSWTGRIIGYRMVPIMETITEAKLKVFKTKKIVKVRK